MGGRRLMLRPNKVESLSDASGIIFRPLLLVAERRIAVLKKMEM
jgi:hypothetical protein